MNGHGRGKVLFGTNYPMLSPSRCRAQVDELDLKPEAKEKFLRLNALKAFGLTE
jgi:hypothetical protein